MQPTSRPRIELEVQDLSMQADTFQPGAPRLRRTALSVRSAELRDCAPRPEGGPGWRKIVAYHATANMAREAAACLFQVGTDLMYPNNRSHKCSAHRVWHWATMMLWSLTARCAPGAALAGARLRPTMPLRSWPAGQAPAISKAHSGAMQVDVLLLSLCAAPWNQQGLV